MQICVTAPQDTQQQQQQQQQPNPSPTQIAKGFIYDFVGKKINKKNRILICLTVQVVCAIFTLVVITLLYRILSKNFIIGLYYSPFIIFYCVPILFLYTNLSEINLVFVLQIISLVSFFIFLAVFSIMYLGIFQPVFAYEFNHFSNNCQIQGIKVISLHQNEKYTIIYATFQDENGNLQMGQACASNNRDGSIFDTNIQPYKFINYLDTYYAYNQDSASYQYTFSKVKIPSWLCMEDQHLQDILKENTQNQIVFPTCRVNQLKQQVGYKHQFGVSDIQYDDNFFIISLTEDDPYYSKQLFIVLNVVGLIPLLMISPQYFILYASCLITKQFISSRKSAKEKAEGKQSTSIINLQKIAMLQKKNSLNDIKDHGYNTDSNKNSSEEEKKQVNNTKSKNNTQTQSTTQPVIINNTLTNNENINLIFNNNNQYDNQYYFKTNQNHSPQQQQQQSPIIQKFLKRFSVSLKEEKSKNSQTKFNSAGDISNQSISINYYHENNLFHLEQYDFPNPLADYESEHIQRIQSNQRFKSKNFTEEI